MSNEADKTRPLAQAGQDEEITVRKSTLLAALGGQKGANEKLLSAAKDGNVSLMTLVLAAGADIDHENENGWTALSYATSGGRIEPVKALLAAGAKVDHEDEDGWTPLLWGAFDGRAEAIKMLLAAGANVLHEDEDGQTALHAAAYSGRTEPIKALLAAGANVLHEDKNGQTALDLAIGRREDVLEILEAATRDAKAKRVAAQKSVGLSGTFTDSTQAGTTTSQSGGQNPGIKQQAISPKLAVGL